MVTTIKGEKYLSIEECIEKLYNFTKGKIKLNKQHFVALIKTYKNQGIDFKTLKHKMHLRLDVFENLMMGANRYDFINRATNLYDKQIGYKEQIVVEPSYRNDEDSMERYSKKLERQYQYEHINRIIKETINEWGKKNIVYNDNDKLELVKDNNVVNGGNFPIKRNGQVYWVSRSNTVSVYVFCKNVQGEWCILSSLRGPKAHVGKGKWNVVCGYLDYGYTLEETAVKECFEETGVKINKNVLKNLGTFSHRKYGDISTRFYAFLEGVTDNYPTSIANCEEGEVSDAKWIPLNEVEKYNWLSNQGQKVKDFAEKMLNNENKLSNNEKYQKFLLSLQSLLQDKLISKVTYEKIINLINVSV